MEKKRKNIKCKCGEDYLKTTSEYYTDFEYEVEMCSKCGYKVFTVEQMKKYQNLLKLSTAETSEPRKIIRIGNSLGITLPQIIKNIGLSVGDTAKLKFLSPQRVQIDFSKSI